MHSTLRLVRKQPSGWTIMNGARIVGLIDTGRLALYGYPDAFSATGTAAAASHVLREGIRHRNSDSLHALTHPVDNVFGIACTVPENAWPASLLELAHRLHMAAIPFRHPEPEPAA